MSAATPGTEPLPDDADDLRGLHFRRLLRRSSTRIALGLVAVVAAVGGTAAGGLGFGAFALAVALATGFGIVFALADARSEEAFFKAYAQQRGLARRGRSHLPRATPLLRKGDKRYAERTLAGPLGGDVVGTLALYTYEETHRDSDGDRHTSYHRYTVGMAEVPECAARVPELYCEQRAGLRMLEGLEDAFRGGKERVELESTALNDRYEIFAGEGQDRNWLRQLFSPSFIVWLAEAAPEKFAFELVGGTLCCYVEEHMMEAAKLDAVGTATAAVATRLREESLE